MFLFTLIQYTPPQVPEPAPVVEEVSDPVLAEINEYRKEFGLAPYIESPETCAFAEYRAKEVLRGWNHEGFLSTTTRESFYGPRHVAAENLAKNYEAQDVVEAWIESPTHEANLRRYLKNACVRSYENHWAFEAANYEN